MSAQAEPVREWNDQTLSQPKPVPRPPESHKNINLDAKLRLTNRVFAAENDLDKLYDWQREAVAKIKSVNSSQLAFSAAAEKQMTAAERRLSDVGEAVDEMARSLEATVTEVHNQGGGFIQSWGIPRRPF